AVVIDAGINYVAISTNTDPATAASASEGQTTPAPDSEAQLREMDAKMVKSEIPARRYDCGDGAADESARGVKMVGDVDSYSVRQKASLLTPVPGGVGPVTVAMTMRNVVMAAEGSMLRAKKNADLMEQVKAKKAA